MSDLLTVKDIDLKKYDIFMDLDKVKTRRSGFLLHGKERTIKPLSILNEAEVINRIARHESLAILNQTKPISAQDLYDSLLGIFTLMCEPFSKEDLDKMPQWECSCLVSLITEHIRGVVKPEDAEKKKI